MSASLADAFLAGSKLAFAAAGLVAGVSVLRLARREPGFGPHALAALAIACGCLGLALFPLGSLPWPGALRETLAAAGEVVLRVGFVLLAVFVWRVFRPASARALGAAIGCSAALVATLVWELRSQASLADYDATLASAWCAQLAFALPFAWSCVESGIEWRRARRRLALGLGDALTASRYGLWVATTGSLTAACMMANAIAWAEVAGWADTRVWLTFTRGLLFLPPVAGIWLGFFPPRWYRNALGAAAAAA